MSIISDLREQIEDQPKIEPNSQEERPSVMIENAQEEIDELNEELKRVKAELKNESKN